MKMKTLNEVIEIASDWTNGFDEMSIEKQMLHYLKEYQRYQNTPSRNGHMALVNYFEESQKNEPLTWDELRTMEGKPVWVEYNRHLSEKAQALSKGWFVIFDFRPLGETEMMLMTNNFVFTLFEQQRDLWQAYRKERE